jgi:hypothetical protein
MPNEQDDKLNKLLGRQGSIVERTRMAKELDDDRLQIAAPYSPQAKEELERRRHESLLASRVPLIAYARLSPEDIDSFERISNVPDTEVAELVPLQVSEAEIKRHFCDIIGNPFPQKDWGGEVCDIFCNIRFRRREVPAAFILKGKAYADRPLRIVHLGKNGDQLVRLFSLPVVVYIIQSNGPIDGAVYSQIEAQVAAKLITNQSIYYLMLDGIQTARLLRAYGKV